MTTIEKVSFTVRRPTPVSRASSSGVDSDGNSSYKLPALPRHLAHTNDFTSGSPLARSTASSPGPPSRNGYDKLGFDSSDDDQIKDEVVTGFDKFGFQRLHPDKRPRSTTPLIIPALKNRDWRELARKRRTVGQYIPSSAKASTGKDGSVGGLGMRDTINSGPVLSGLQLPEQPAHMKEEFVKQEEVETPSPTMKIKNDDDNDDDDKLALRAILTSADGPTHDGPVIDIIPPPMSEADAYKQDVGELPESSSLEDYDRVPVSQFGAALLRGMGWKEGTAATRQPGKGLVKPYLPEARPALLGIGAKEREVFDDGSKRRGRPNQQQEKRYVPVVKMERSKTSTSVSRRSERGGRSQSPRPRDDSLKAESRRGSRSRDRESDYDGVAKVTPSRESRRTDYDRGRTYRHSERDRRDH